MAGWAADHLERDDFSSNRHPALDDRVGLLARAPIRLS